MSVYVYEKFVSEKGGGCCRAIIATSVKSIVWKMTGFDKSFVGFARACFFSPAFCSRPRSGDNGGGTDVGGEVCHLKSLSCRIQFDRKYYNKVLYHLSEKLWRKPVLSSREFNAQASSGNGANYTLFGILYLSCVHIISLLEKYTAEEF